MAGKSSLDDWARKASQDAQQSPMGRLMSFVEGLDRYGSELFATKSPNVEPIPLSLLPWIACCSSEKLPVGESGGAESSSSCTEDDEVIARRDVDIVGMPFPLTSLHYSSSPPAMDKQEVVHPSNDQAVHVEPALPKPRIGSDTIDHADMGMRRASQVDRGTFAKPAQATRRASGGTPRGTEILHDAGIPGMSMSMAVSGAAYEDRSTSRADPALRSKPSRQQSAFQHSCSGQTLQRSRRAEEDVRQPSSRSQRPQAPSVATPARQPSRPPKSPPVSNASRLLSNNSFAGELHDEFLSAALAAADGVGTDDE